MLFLTVAAMGNGHIQLLIDHEAAAVPTPGEPKQEGVKGT